MELCEVSILFIVVVIVDDDLLLFISFTNDEYMLLCVVKFF